VKRTWRIFHNSRRDAGSSVTYTIQQSFHHSHFAGVGVPLRSTFHANASAALSAKNAANREKWSIISLPFPSTGCPVKMVLLQMEIPDYRQASAWDKWHYGKHGASQAPRQAGTRVLHHRGDGWMMDLVDMKAMPPPRGPRTLHSVGGANNH